MSFIPSSRLIRSRPAIPRAASAAFTLLEILVVLGIMALLVGLAVTNIKGIFGNQQVNVATMFVNNSKTFLFPYKLSVGDYPSTQEGLQALITAPSGKTDRWRGPYIESNTGKPPLDPWGREYQYAYPGPKHPDKEPDIWSMGPDGVSGTADDIGNWPAPVEGDAQK